MSVEIHLAWVSQMAAQGDLAGLARAAKEHEAQAKHYAARKLNVTEQEHRKVARWAEFSLMRLIAEMRRNGKLAPQGASKQIAADPTKSPYYYGGLTREFLHSLGPINQVTDEQFATAMAECGRIKNYRRQAVWDFLGVTEHYTKVQARKKKQELLAEVGQGTMPKGEWLRLLQGSATALAGISIALEKVRDGKVAVTAEEINSALTTLERAGRLIFQTRKSIKENLINEHQAQ